jgi:subtilisin family serine protease
LCNLQRNVLSGQEQNPEGQDASSGCEFLNAFELESRNVQPYRVSLQPAERATSPSVARPEASDNPLDLVGLTALMGRSAGRREIRIGLIDGPVALDHAELAADRIEAISNAQMAACASGASAACAHGTFVAGILSGRRGSTAPALCPDCTLLLRPIFSEQGSGTGWMPSATPDELADAVRDCVEAGAHVLNISSALVRPSIGADRKLEAAFDHAMRRGVLVVAAAGNQGSLGSTAITRHPWVIPVTACDLRLRPLNYANLGSSIGRNGLTAPGEGITSLTPEGASAVSSGTSIAAPLVSGAIALLWSEFPDARAVQIKFALTRAHSQRRASVVPPLLDAIAAYRVLAATKSQRTYP